MLSSKHTLLVLSFLFSIPFPGLANTRMVPTDTACLEQYVNFKYNYDSKLHAEAAYYIRILIKDCPALYESMYQHGGKLYISLLKEETSEIRKEGLIDTLLLLQGLRIEHFGKEGYVLGKKGVLMRKYRPKEVEATYEILNRSVQLQGLKSTVPVLNVYFGTVVKMAKLDKLQDRDVLDRFEFIMEIIRTKVSDPKAEKVHDKYYSLRRNLLIMGKPYLVYENVVPWKEADFPAHMDSIEWLRASLRTLAIADCQFSAITNKIAKRLHELAPSSYSAYRLGIKAIGTSKFDLATKYFKQAVSISESDTTTIKYYIKIAEVKRVQKKFKESRTYLLKVLELDPSNGEAFELLGGVYCDFANYSGLDEFERGSIYWVGVDAYKKAISLNVPLSHDLRLKIVRLEANFPKKNELFFRKLEEGADYEVGYWIRKVTKIRTRKVD